MYTHTRQEGNTPFFRPIHCTASLLARVTYTTVDLCIDFLAKRHILWACDYSGETYSPENTVNNTAGLSRQTHNSTSMKLHTDSCYCKYIHLCMPVIFTISRGAEITNFHGHGHFLTRCSKSDASTFSTVHIFKTANQFM